MVHDGSVAAADTLFELTLPPADPHLAGRPVGSVVTVGYGRDGVGTATFDAERRYRYRLSRVWDAGRDRCCFVLLNPSLADARAEDPTLRRCVSFARRWGFGAVEIVNVFALRATDPRDLYGGRASVDEPVRDPVGQGNTFALLAAARAAALVVAGWGNHAARVLAPERDRAAEVRRTLSEAGVALHALRLTKAGHPGHPLYVRATTTPQPYAASRME